MFDNTGKMHRIEHYLQLGYITNSRQCPMLLFCQSVGAELQPALNKMGRVKGVVNVRNDCGKMDFVYKNIAILMFHRKYI